MQFLTKLIVWLQAEAKVSAINSQPYTLEIPPWQSHRLLVELKAKGIDAVFLGPAQKYPNADKRAFYERNPASVILVRTVGTSNEAHLI